MYLCCCLSVLPQCDFIFIIRGVDKICHEILWISRKKNCEERCRLAETKLTLPLMIFLIVLIVIVITPALLDL